MSDAHRALQVTHVARAEHVAHHTAALVHVESAAFGGDHARGVLATVLQNEEPVVEQLVDGRFSDDADDSAHRIPHPNPLPQGEREATVSLHASRATSLPPPRPLCGHPSSIRRGKNPYYPPPCTRLARVSIVETTLGSLEVDALGQSVREPGANVLGEGHKRRTGERVPPGLLMRQRRH